jgi:FkbH-like protein
MQNILFLRNYTVEPIISDLENLLLEKKIFYNFELSNYDNYISLILKKDFPKKKYSFIFVSISFDVFFKKNYLKKKIDKNLCSTILQELNIIINSIKEKQIKLLLILLPTVGIYSHNFNKFLDREKKEIKKKYNNIDVMDLDEIYTNNKKIFYAKKHWNSSLFPFESKVSKIISKKLSNYLLHQNGKNHKLIIVDADNTLWGGVIGEDGINKVNLGKNKIGIFFKKFQLDLLFLKNKGIVLALCSKNNLDEIKNLFYIRSKDMHIKLSDFTIIKANWNNKAENIMQILKELNLSPENSLFIDDNSHEIDLVKNQIPKIDCFQIKPNEKNISIIDNVVNFLSTKLTNEDKNRTKYYNQEIKRNIFKNRSLNLDKYIKDLNINLIIRVNSKKNIDRLSQLTQRTNQFNTTTVRMTSSDLKDYLDNKTNYVFELSANDKFGDYGIIGIAFIKTYNNQKAIIENFLFSCRAIGREMEDYFIITIIKFLESKRINRLYINFIFNNKNVVAKEYFNNKNILISNNLKKQTIKICKNNFINTSKLLMKVNYEI